MPRARLSDWLHAYDQGYPTAEELGDQMNNKTRWEHMAWCKQRALEYVDSGDLHGAFASFASDLGKHPETAPAVNLISGIGMPLLMTGHLDTPREMRDFIEGFN